jgi:transcriptional regulator with XRE-family HTH domain
MDRKGAPAYTADIPRRKDSGTFLVDESLRRAVGRNLIALRAAHRLEQTELALLMGVDKSVLSRIEKGHRLPPRTLDWHVDLADALGISFTEVMTALYAGTPLQLR